MTAGSRIGAAAFAIFTGLSGAGATMRTIGFGAGRTMGETRGDLLIFNLADLPVPARAAATFALRAAGLATRATFRAAGRLRDAALLATGFLDFEAFFAGISFSAPG
jgi:hypothetical protein